jgi:hypothetical protein
MYAFATVCVQDLLKELEEFAFKGIPDLRGCSEEEPVSAEEMVSRHPLFISIMVLFDCGCCHA